MRIFGCVKDARLYKFRRTRIALWEAPITPIVRGLSDGRSFERRGGFRAGSRPSSWNPDTGRGPVAGLDPVQRTSRFDEIVVGPGNFSSGE